MKSCIIYDTKRENRAAEHFVRWMKKALEKAGAEVGIYRAADAETIDCDLFIIGSPIYYERPMKTVLDFIESHSEDLKGKPTAIFVICMAQLFGNPTKRHIERYYITPLVDRLPEKPVDIAVFKGWLRKTDRDQKEIAVNWIIELLGRVPWK